MTIGRIPSVEGGIQPTIVDAKGDLIAATAADTVNRLAVGSNDQVLVADSSASTGLAWKSVATPFAAGKNALINGGMDIWQRGTSFTNGGLYTADRWFFDISASTVTSTRESSIVPAGFQYSWKINKSAGSATATLIGQTIETANAIQFAGKTVAVSFYAAADSATTFTPVLTYSTSADNPRTGSWTNITPTVNGSTSVSTTTFVRVVSTFAVPSNAKSLYFYIEPSIASGVNIYITGFQLELGSVATAFTRAGGTIQGERSACERYYWRYTGSSAYATYGTGSAISSTQAEIVVNFPTTMRTNPTSAEGATLALGDGVNAVSAVTTIVVPQSNLGKAIVRVDATGLTQYRPYVLINNNSLSGYLGFSAEL